MATYVNDLRLTELATGEGSGTWGTTTNTNLELIGEALGYGTQDCFTTDADATTTVADGATDPARSMYFKVTSSATLTATRVLTIAPNTVSRVMFIENATTGSQSITISQGSGANVTIATGKTAVVYLDGAGSTAAVVDAMALVDPGVTDTLAEVLTAGNTSSGTNIELTTTDKVQFRDSAIYINSSTDGQLDIVADTEVQIATTTVDLNGILDVSGNTTLGADVTFTGASYNAVWDSSDNALEFADNAKAVFGAGDDLQIYHDGSNSYIKDAGSGGIIIDSYANLTLGGTIGASLENYLTATGNGEVTLYYDNSARLATTFTGIDVTGTVDMDGFTSVGNGTITGDLLIQEGSGFPRITLKDTDGTNTQAFINHSGSDLTLTTQDGTSNGRLIFARFDGTTTTTSGYFDANGKLFLNGDLDVGGTTDLDGLTVDGTVTITTADNTTQLTLKSTDDDASAGPVLDLVRDSASPADNDIMGRIRFRGDDDGGSLSTMVYMQAILEDASAGTLDAGLDLFAQLGGTQRRRLTINSSGTVFNDDSVNLDFRVESDGNTHALFVDASLNSVGINQSSPGATLDVSGNAQVVHTGASPLIIDGTSAAGIAYVPIANIATSAVGNGAGIELRAESTVQERQLAFLTAEWSDNTDATRTTAMELYNTIAGTGRRILSQTGSQIVINQDGRDLDFRVESDSNEHMFFVDAGNDSIGFDTDSTGSAAKLYLDTEAKEGLRIFRSTAVANFSAISFYDQTQATKLGAIGMNTNQLRLAGHTNTVFENDNTGGAFIFNESGIDTDLRVESDNNSSVFVVDASTDRVGVGTGGPVKLLEVGSTTGSSTITPTEMVISTRTSASDWLTGSSNEWGILGFYKTDTSGGGASNVATIGASMVNAIGGYGSLHFKLQNTGNSYALEDWLTLQNSASSSSRQVVVAAEGGLQVDQETNIDGVITLGSAAYFIANSSNGFRFNNSGDTAQLLFIKDTGESVFNENSLDYDFRVESDGYSHMMFVDASLNYLGIAEATPAQTLDIGVGGLQIQGNIAAPASGTSAMQVDYFSGGARYWARGDTVGVRGTHKFYTLTNTGGSQITPLIIDTTGGAIFNEDSADADFRIESDSNANMLVVDASTNTVAVGASTSTATLGVHSSVDGTEAAPHFLISGAASTYRLSMWLDGTAAYIGQDSTIRAVRIYSGAETAGVALTNGATSWSTYSDERLKENVEPIENALQSLSGLRTVKYHLKDVDGPEDKKKIGVIAQDLVGVLDEVIDPTFRPDDDTEYMGVRYTELVPVLIKAIQEQQNLIESLTARVAELESN